MMRCAMEALDEAGIRFWGMWAEGANYPDPPLVLNIPLSSRYRCELRWYLDGHYWLSVTDKDFYDFGAYDVHLYPQDPRCFERLVSSIERYREEFKDDAGQNQGSSG